MAFDPCPLLTAASSRQYPFLAGLTCLCGVYRPSKTYQVSGHEPDLSSYAVRHRAAAGGAH